MHCDTIQEQISRLIDNDLAIDETQAVFSHLGACAACTVFYSQAVSIGKRLRHSADTGFPHELDALLDRTISSLSAAPAPARRMMPDRIRMFVRTRIVLPVPAAIAVFIAALGISIFLLRSFAPGLLPVERETKIVVAYPPVEVVADQTTTD
jgi:anti-sigma factor RsiW